MKKHIIRAIVIVCALFTAGPVVDGFLGTDLIVKDVEAIIGRPLTPVSVAGVARRTTRRVIRRSTVYVAVLPARCSVVNINGVNLHHCGATYYQPYGNQYVVVSVE
ncbi:MAG: hypothetical protein WBB23_24005 [Desulforhopalus sp.]